MPQGYGSLTRHERVLVMYFEDLLIEVSTLSKCFHIYDKPMYRLKQFIVPRMQRVLGIKQNTYMREFWALHNVSFVVRKGETIGIIGRNGSGKSTLLQMICGTLTPTSGYVRVNGRIAALLELGAGFNPEFSGRDNVYLAGSIAGLSHQEVRDRFSEIEAFAEIGEFIDQPVKTYSSGMFVRLAFAAAIHTSPDVLVVDEALAVGDTAFQTKCLTRIREMQRRGTTILLVTHSTNTLIEYCDRAVYLKRGHLVGDGACRDVVKQYADDLVEEEGGIAIAEQCGEVVAANRGAREEASQKMRIQSVEVLNSKGELRKVFGYGEMFEVIVKVSVSSIVSSPCFGIQIKSSDDIVLWSCTTQSMDLLVSQCEQGEYCLRWTCFANFSGNRYILAIGVGEIEGGEYRRHARMPYAGYIDVLPQLAAGGGWLAPCPKFALSGKAA